MLKMKAFRTIGLLLVLTVSCGKVKEEQCLPPQPAIEQNTHSSASMLDKDNSKPSETAYFGAGCFWCVEAVYESLQGVDEVESGYMGGQMKDPDYRAVCSGQTGHAEVVRIRFNPQIINFETLLEWFWRSHDPTTLNRQGADVGTQYRSAIFYLTETQQRIAEDSKNAAQSIFEDPIVTEITPAAVFYPAEEEHQGYYQANRAAPYCQFVIRPKLKKLKLE